VYNKLKKDSCIYIKPKSLPVIPNYKICNTCLKNKRNRGFTQNKRSKDGLMNFCKDCRNNKDKDLCKCGNKKQKLSDLCLQCYRKNIKKPPNIRLILAKKRRYLAKVAKKSGLNNKEIAKLLKVRVGRIETYLREDYEELKEKNRLRRYKDPLRFKAYDFVHKKCKPPKPKKPAKHRAGDIVKNKLYQKAYGFIRGRKDSIVKNIGEKIRKVIDYVKCQCDDDGNTTCYLTGKQININNYEDFELDHKTPRSRDGDSTVDNCGIASYEVNRAKSNLTEGEFIQMCRDIVKHADEI
jgi:hypothetical protein